VTPSSPTARFTPDRLRHSLLSQGCAQVFKLLVSIGIGGWMARYLGPQNLGTLSYVAALVGLLGPLGSLGVKGSLSAMLCEERPLPGLLGSALLIELIGTLVIAVVLIPFAWAARDPVVVGLIGLAVVGNLLGSAEVFEVELLNRQQGTQLARLSTIQTVAGALLSALALLAQAPLLVFGGLPVIQAGIRGWLLALVVQAAKPLQLLKQATWETSRDLIKRGWPLLLAGLSVMLYMKSDQVMLEWLRGPADVGQYSVAVRVAESLYFLPVVLANTFLPRIGRGSGRFESDPGLRQLYRSAWLLGVGMALTSMLALPPLVPLVFGDEFLPAQAALVWLGPAAFAVATGCASGAWLNTQGHQKLIAQRSAIGALVNIVLNLLLIPRMGFSGAALASSVSYLASVYLVGILRREISANLINLILPFRHVAVQS
jgi:O-antigen/teichoic acid export membrane protein